MIPTAIKSSSEMSDWRAPKPAPKGEESHLTGSNTRTQPRAQGFWPHSSRGEIHRITWENAGRFLGWDPFTLTAQEDANVGALRARAIDLDVTRMPRAEWKARNKPAGIGVFCARPAA